MLTLENFPATLERGMEIEPLSIIYFVTFVLVAALIVLNVLIGVVLHSMEEARVIHAREELRERGVDATEEEAELEARIAAIRSALDDLERDLLRQAPGRPSG
jgi:voltage-gated sodium channel